MKLSSSTVKKLTLLFSWRYGIFLVVFMIGVTASVYGLRQNNLTMISLREQVYSADKSGGDVSAALNDLRTYVYGHMNTNLSSGGNAIKPPIQLKYTYERLVVTERVRVEKVNAQVYADAQAYCEQQNPAGRSRVPCVEDYVSRNSVKEKLIPEALYKFDFISPAWSSDLAGWSLIVSSLSALAFLSTLIFDRWVRVNLSNIN